MQEDDQAFFNAMDTANQALKDAIHRAVKVDTSLLPHSQIGKYGDLVSRLDAFHAYSGYFRELGRISGGTQPAASLAKDAGGSLNEYRLGNTAGNPTEHIRNVLDGFWEGPASDAFDGFSGELATALANQEEALMAMSMVMGVHQAIIDSVRQKYLDLIVNTTAAIEGNIEQEKAGGIKTLANMVAAVVAGLSAGGGLLLGAVVGTISGIGGILDGIASDAANGDWSIITNDTLDKLGALVDAAWREARALEESLKEIDSFMKKEPENFVVKDVNLAGG